MPSVLGFGSRHAGPADDDRAPPAPGQPLATGPVPPAGGAGGVRLLRPLLGGELPSAGLVRRRGRSRVRLRGLRAPRRRAQRRQRRDRGPAPPRAGGSGRAAGSPSRVCPITVVVEPLEPPELFDWFVSFRESLGMTVVPVGPPAAGCRSARRSRANEVVCLLSRPRHPGRGGRGRVLRRADDAAGRPGHPRAAHRRARFCRPRCTSPPSATATTPSSARPIATRTAVARCARTSTRITQAPGLRAGGPHQGRRPSSGTCSSPTGPPTRDMALELVRRCPFSSPSIYPLVR